MQTGAADWTQLHTYGALWIPQNGSTPGSIQWFFDDMLLGRPITMLFKDGFVASSRLAQLSPRQLREWVDDHV